MIDIGSSEAPAVLGVSPHTTPWRLWATKVGLLPDAREETEVMKRGRQLEHAVLDMFMEEQGEFGLVTVAPHTTRWRQELPWHRSSPDATIARRYGSSFFAPEQLPASDFSLVEVKCVVGHPPSAPRADWLVQCLHQRTGFPEAARQFLVCFGNLTLAWWELPKHQGAMDRVLREEERFLERVLKQEPPPVRAADASILGKAWPITTKEPVELDSTLQFCAALAEEKKREISLATTILNQHEALLKAALANHEEGVFPNGGRITWKPYTRKGYQVQEQIVRRLTIKTNGGDE